MSRRRGRPRPLVPVLLWGLSFWGFDCAGAAQPAAPVPASALQACAEIGSSAERLACYDRLAGRVPPPSPQAGAPAAAVRASSGAAAPSSPSPPQDAGAPPSPPPPQTESFGLYHAEHPAPPPAAKSLTARVVGLGVSSNGRTTVTLEGGELWELDDADPVLAQGDSVTITRAAFGSFLMTTPSRRTHRAHRLR